MKYQARVWKFGDNINTDLILPVQAFYLTPAEQAQWVFRANRPGWSEQVRAGDILVGGRNFGMGSSRPAARSLKNLGLSCLVAQSINGLFFRNCVNFAFPAMECVDVFATFEEGDIAEVDFDAATVKNITRGTALEAIPLPPKLLDLLKAGGIYALLEKEGAIGPKTAASG
jgi:3-isopropylmalate/(R)-2-methylmalate dehydratase small subunit